MSYFVDFSRGKWNKDDFSRLDCFNFPYRTDLEQLDNCIANGYSPIEMFNADLEKVKSGVAPSEIEGFDRGGLFTQSACMYKEKQKNGVSFSVDFSFDEFGAPTFFYSREIIKEGDSLVSAEGIEATAFEKGINFWHSAFDKENKKTNFKKVGHFPYPLERKKIYTIELLTVSDKFGVKLAGQGTWVDFPMYDTGYIGFYACEGINRFYNFKIV